MYDPPDVAAFASSLTTAAEAADVTELQRRLMEVERRLAQRDDEDAKSKAAAKKKFTARPFGRIHVEAASFDQDDANRMTVGEARNGVDIRRARLGAEGEGFDVFAYRFDLDFVTFDGSTISRPIIADAYLDMKEVPILGNLRIGHFREPFSLERLDSTNDLPFIERAAAVSSLTPFRNVGIMAFNWNDTETMTWSAGVFDENTNEFGEDYHDRTGISATGRLTWLPYYEECDGVQHLLHFGTSYSFRHVGENHVRRFASVPEIFLKEGLLLRTPNSVDTGPMSIDDYHVFGAEAARDWGPLAIQGEYIFASGRQTNGSEFFFQGGYIEAMYWWTGESRNYNRQQAIHGAVMPRQTFLDREDGSGCRSGCGAWESTLRLSTLDLDDGAIRGGRMTNLTVGLNWYYTVRSRFMLNYIHSFLDRAGRNSDANIFAARFQYAF